jgi:hypothetical protein
MKTGSDILTFATLKGKKYDFALENTFFKMIK